MRIIGSGANAPARGVIVGGPLVAIKRFESSLLFFINVSGSALAVWWLTRNQPSMIEISFFLVSACVTMIGMGVGIHRLFAHRSFECGAALRTCLAAAGMMGCQGSILKWVANHRRHHMHSDAPGDPHSPLVDGHGKPMPLWRGMAHAHMGWLFDDTMSDFEIYARDLLRDPMVMFFHRTRWCWYCASFFILPGLYGFVLGGVEHALGTILIGGILKTFLVLNAIASIASIGHTFGSMRFEIAHDRSRNNAVLAWLTFGEGWHNNHHRHPRAAHIGLAWYEIDVNGAIIHALARMGLAWNVVPHLATRKRPADLQPALSS
jgi:stearoyl-CoA desaturase (delta-9 desaturase)